MGKGMRFETVLWLMFIPLVAGCSGGGGGGGAGSFTVGGTVTGLNGTLVLQNNGGDDLTLTTDGAFTFAASLADGSAYQVTVQGQPQGQLCSVGSGSGAVSGTKVTDVAVECVDSGSLDRSFDTDGKAVNDNAAGGSGADEGLSITTLAGGKVLVAGYSWNGTDDDMVIWRYTDNGTLDTSFGTGGIVVNDNAAGGNGADHGVSITVDANGKILVAGYSWNGTDDDMAIWRYTGNGTLDTTFGTGGIVVQDDAAGGTGADRGASVTVDANGRILVAGYSWNGTDDDMVIWRYNGDGTLDTSFDTDGMVVHNSAAGGNGADHGWSVSTAANGKIVVAGDSWNGANSDMVIWRYNGDGTLDTSFDTDGIVVDDNAAGGTSGNDSGQAVITDANGKILVTGYSNHNPFDSDLAIWRYNGDGTLDTGFDTDGIVSHNNAAGGFGNDWGQSITIDANGRILVTGSSDYGADFTMVIWRYNSDGSLDTTFGTGGIAGGEFVPGEGRSVTVDTSGRILVTGGQGNGFARDMVIWRYHP